jgi:TatA/E family protein of Tat protein translocase
MIAPGCSMFGPLGFPEMLFILVLALLIFGPKRLPEVGRTIGKGMAQFRRATTDLKRTIENEIALEEEPARQPARALRRAELPQPAAAAPAPAATPVQTAQGTGEVPPAVASDPDTSQPV